MVRFLFYFKFSTFRPSTCSPGGSNGPGTTLTLTLVTHSSCTWWGRGLGFINKCWDGNSWVTPSSAAFALFLLSWEFGLPLHSLPTEVVDEAANGNRHTARGLVPVWSFPIFIQIDFFHRLPRTLCSFYVSVTVGLRPVPSLDRVGDKCRALGDKSQEWERSGGGGARRGRRSHNLWKWFWPRNFA